MNNILMNAPMALATQQGIKTQTRREVTEHFDYVGNDGKLYIERTDGYGGFAEPWMVGTKYKIGQVLWVREPAKVISFDAFKAEMKCKYLSDGMIDTFDIPEKYIDSDFDNNCDGDKDEVTAKWIRNCQGIPNGCIREMARTFIRVTNIRVERLNEISEEDAIKEGIEKMKNGVGYHDRTALKAMVELGHYCDTAKEAFDYLWESINGRNSFDNRWVWVLEFEKISKEEVM